MTDIDLSGRVVAITGSSQGLGMTMAKGLAEAGAKVVLASPDTERLEAVAAEIGAGRALAVTTDISVEEDCTRMLERAIAAFGHLDALINNARNPRRGLADYKRALFWERPVDFWEAAVRINVFGTYLMTRTVIPHMLERGAGRIVNISTGIGSIQQQANSPYGVTKAAIDAATIIWAKDLASRGVTVNTLLPGGACETDRPREKAPTPGELLPMEVMVPPAQWLVSAEACEATGGRYLADRWDATLTANEAAQKCLVAPIFLPPMAED
jgi:NAD(P)-dependent dehydrogenase (short-subunit alcohol dehydrogenase family)